MSLDAATVKAAAGGRWLVIHEALAPALHAAIPKRGRHVACPVHGGTDGFRLFKDADQTGGGICNTCGDFPDGFALLQWVNRWDFPTTLRAVADHLGLAVTNGHAAGERTATEIRERLTRTWRETRADEGRLGAYLRARGLSGAVPPALRFHPSLGYYTEGRHAGDFPAMVAPVRRLDGETVALHRTFLAVDGPGKAPVDPAKKLTTAVRDGATKGAAIRLAEAAGDTLALAEGIETAIAVMEATGLPTWATGSAGALEAVELPRRVTRVYIFADHDANGRGQQAAEVAARRFRAEGREVAVLVPAIVDADFLDVLVTEGPEAIRQAVAAAPLVGSPAGAHTNHTNGGPEERNGDSVNCVTLSWPAPLEAAAFHGLAGDFVRLVEPHTEADEAALLLQFLVAAGNLIGRGPHFVAEADRHFANLNAAMVGETSRGRKGSSLGQVRRPLRAVDPVWTDTRMQSGLSTGEGLLHAVRDPVRKASGEVLDEGVGDKRLLVVEPELASVLRIMQREGSILSPLLRQAWDTGTLQTLTRNNPLVATGAHVSVIGHITKDELLRYLDRTESANGFGNRFLWVGVRRSKVLPEGGALDTVDFEPWIARFSATVQAVRREGLREWRRDAEARARWAEVYPALSDGRPGMLGAVTSRAEAQTMRLALLYAVLDGAPEIRRVHLEAGLAVWRYAFDSARYIFGEATGDPVADEMLAALRAAPSGLTRTDISNLFGRNRRADEITRALAALEAGGRARRCRTATGGRPVERWTATAGGGHAR